MTLPCAFSHVVTVAGKWTIPYVGRDMGLDFNSYRVLCGNVTLASDAMYLCKERLILVPSDHLIQTWKFEGRLLSDISRVDG